LVGLLCLLQQVAVGSEASRGKGGDEGRYLTHEAVELKGLEPLMESVGIHRTELQRGLFRQRDVHQDLG